ncbi:MAG: hypothetical protein ACKVTZ_04030 [Bacteroidia bacterium]
MAFPKKGLRKIIVEEKTYFWRVNRQPESYEGGLWVSIFPEHKQNKYLQYYPTIAREITKKIKIGDSDYQYISEVIRIPVTNKLIRNIILAALKNGWEQAENGFFSAQHYFQDVTEETYFDYHKNILKARLASEEFLQEKAESIEKWAHYFDETKQNNLLLFYEKSDENVGYRNVTFLLNMMMHYAQQLKIERKEYISFFQNFNFLHYSPSNEETYAYFDQVMMSKNLPKSLQNLHYEQPTMVFMQKNAYAMVAKAGKNLIGLIRQFGIEN